MKKDAFLRMLRQGLTGLPPHDIEDILADYRAHFVDAAASGRSEEQAAAALGDPARIARELKADAGLRQFEARWSLSNLGVAMLALAGLTIFDFLFLLPVFIALVAVAFGLAAALFGIGVAGIAVLFKTLVLSYGTAGFAEFFTGAGLLSGSIGGFALLLLCAGAAIRILGRYVRLHFQLIQTAN